VAQEGMSTGFNTKQKVMAGVFVVIVIFLIYQVVGMFGGSSDTPKITPQQTAVKPTMQQAGKTTMPAMQAGAPTQPMPAAQPQQVQPLKGLVATNDGALKKQQEQQQQFLTTVNELQMLKLQRDLAETTQAISAAKLATATAEKNISDLFIKQGPSSGADYSNKFLNPALPGQPPIQQAPAPATYVVISVSMQMHHWMAVLGNQGKLYNVSVGDILPVDGWVVESISREGVILRKDKEVRKISLVPVI
jgi:type IV pilus biogenesis protein PilP